MKFLISFMILVSAQMSFAGEINFLSERFMAASELFDVNNGLGGKTLLKMLEEKIKAEGALTTEETQTLRSAICISKNNEPSLVEIILRANQQLEQLKPTTSQGRKAKALFKKLNMQTSIISYVNFCQDQIDANRLVIDARASHDLEYTFAVEFSKIIN